MTNTREIASKILQHLYLNNDFEKACEKNKNFNDLEQRDRGFVRLIVLESLRRNKQLDFIIKLFLKKPIDKNKIFFLSKKFKFENYIKSQNFVNEVGKISEDEGHHPDISFGWGYAEIKITTHAIKGLSENDFILAAKIDKITNV